MHQFDLNKTIVTFRHKEGNSEFTIGESFQNVGIWGITGGGKTSGSFKKFLSKYLAHEYGGLILTAKADDRKVIEKYVREANRLDDLIIVEPGGKYYFNFIDHVASHSIKGVTSTENLVHVLKTVIRSSEEKGDGKGDDVFWQKSQDLLISHVIRLCMLAYSKISIKEIYEIAITAPRKEDGDDSKKKSAFNLAFETAQEKVSKQVANFEKNLSKDQRASLSNKYLFEKALLQALPDAIALKEIDQFFLDHYRNLAERTRSIIDFSFTGFLYKLLQEPIHSLFCNEKSNFCPEMCFEGKIILLDIPVRVYNEAGRDAQILFKYLWQRTMEKRVIEANSRPVFLASDENHLFIHEYDADFLATARSSRVANLLVSQSIPSYHANMGGAKSEYRVKALLANIATKVFHLNTCEDTNKYASNLIGEEYIEDIQTSNSLSGEFSTSESKSYKLEKIVRPEEFTWLKSGGANNNYSVEAYIHKAGLPFFNGDNHRKITFKQ